MHIKSKLRRLLKDLLVRSSESDYRNRVANRQSIKNVILEDNLLSPELLSQSPGGFMRVLASDEDNAIQISERLTRYKDELGVQSVHIAKKAVEYFSRPNKLSLYSRSVVLKLQPKALLQSSNLVLLQDHHKFIKEEVLDCDDIPERKPEHVVIDFSSPNIAKPFHFGHLKSTILGNYLSNLNTFLGNQVTKLNYIGDWGTQYGLLSLGLEQFKSNEPENGTSKSALKYLVDVYAKANELGHQDESFYIEAKRRFALMCNETESKELDEWRKIRDISIEELKKSYSRLGVEFDVFEYESDYAKKSTELIEQMRSNDLVKVLEDGVVVAQVEKNNRILNIPVLKSDGASLYITRDVAAAIDRRDKFDYDKMLYVVGADQEKHFHSLREIIGILGYNWKDRLIHVKMGKVMGMSSRKGQFVLLSDIIDEATKLYIASTRGTSTSKITHESDIKDVGHNLALSALFVYDMRNSRTHNYQFSWDELTYQSSRSGINLQATFARLSSLLDRASSIGLKPVDSLADLNPDAMCCVEGMNLLSRLDELDNELHSSYWSMDPNPLVNHALHLCKAVNRARKSERLRVIDEQDERKARTRLSLFKSSYRQLELIIKLIGLKPLYKV